MRILFVTDNLQKGGAEKQVACLAKGLYRRNHQITVISLGRGGYWHDYLIQAGIPVIEGTIRRSRYVALNYVFEVLLILWLARTMRRLRPQAVIAIKYRCSFWSITAAWLARVPIRISYRMGLEKQQRIEQKLDHLNGLVHRATSKVVGNSHAVIQSIARTEPIALDAMHVIYQSVELPSMIKGDSFRQAQSIPANAVIVGLLANFYAVKNHVLLVHAARRVVAQHPNTYFLMPGADPVFEMSTRTEVDQLITQFYLGDHAQTIDALIDPTAFLAAIDIGVICSFSEGFSNVILEYMAHGKPVVATRVGGNPEAVRDGENGYLVASDDAEALATALIRLVKDPEQRAKMGENGRKWVAAALTQSRELDQWEKLLESLTKPKKKGRL